RVMAEIWWWNPQYSHGYFVPLFALIVVWSRRRRLAPGVFLPSWWGVALLALAVTLRLIGAYYYFVWLDMVSLLPCLAGICVLMGGWPACRWCWPAIAFLGFMVP